MSSLLVAPEQDVPIGSPPARVAREWLGFLGWLAVCLYFALVAFAVLGAAIGKFDESIPLLGGRLVLQGQKPGADFWSVYPPFIYYLAGAGFRVIGQTVLALRLINITLFGFFLYEAACFLREEMKWRALVSWAILLQIAAIGGNLIIPFSPGFLLAFLSLLLYLRAWRQEGLTRSVSFVASGLLAGLAVLTRINFGLYALAVVCLDLFAMDVLRRKQARSITDRFQSFVGFAAPFVLVNAIVYGVGYGSSAGAVFDQSVVTMNQYLKFGSIPFDLWSGTAAIALPVIWLIVRFAGTRRRAPNVAILAGLAIVALGLLLREKTSISVLLPGVIIVSIVVAKAFLIPLRRWEFCLLLFYACVLHYYLTRADIPHLVALAVCASMLIAGLICSGELPMGRPAAATLLIGIAAVMPLVHAVRPSLTSAKAGLHRAIEFARSPSLSDAERFRMSDPLQSSWFADSPDEIEVLRYIQPRTAAGEPIYVGLVDHSRGFVNCVRLYWLADRPPGVSHPVFDGTTMDAPEQKNMIADLEKEQVGYAILENARFLWTNTGYAGSHLLDQYLAAHYREVARFGGFSVRRRISGDGSMAQPRRSFQESARR